MGEGGRWYEEPTGDEKPDEMSEGERAEEGEGAPRYDTNIRLTDIVGDQAAVERGWNIHQIARAMEEAFQLIEMTGERLRAERLKMLEELELSDEEMDEVIFPEEPEYEPDLGNEMIVTARTIGWLIEKGTEQREAAMAFLLSLGISYQLPASDEDTSEE